MYEEITYESILDRMLSKIPSNMDKREGSIIYDAIAPCALELQLMYIELDNIIKETFADTSSREYLIRRAKERGIEPKASTYAVLKGEFNCEVEIGSRFSNEELKYEVVEKVGNFVYKLKCETKGTIGNRFFGEILPIDYVSGLESAEITELLIPAEDDEETESIRERYFGTFERFSFGGNISDYLDKVNSLKGVGGARVIPVWNGGGTVKVTIIDSDFNKGSDTLVDFVQNEVDPSSSGDGSGIAPIGHIVTVETVEEVLINVKTNLVLESGYILEDVETRVVEVIEKYFLELRKTWESENIVVRIAQIEALILSITGVLDVENTVLNNIDKNLILNEFQIPVLEGVESYE